MDKVSFPRSGQVSVSVKSVIELDWLRLLGDEGQLEYVASVLDSAACGEIQRDLGKQFFF